jgi:hypothetical protein
VFTAGQAAAKLASLVGWFLKVLAGRISFPSLTESTHPSKNKKRSNKGAAFNFFM